MRLLLFAAACLVVVVVSLPFTGWWFSLSSLQCYFPPFYGQTREVAMTP